MKYQKGLTILTMCLAMIFFTLPVYGEDIKNSGDCDVCPGAIHYGDAESNKIMGKGSFELIMQLNEFMKIKIDLDGVKKNGTEATPDAGYELVAWGRGNTAFYIQSIKDESIIQLTTNIEVNSSGKASGWKPEIFISTGHGIPSKEIQLNDKLENAWKKLAATEIYKWIGTKHTDDKWMKRLGEKIRSVAFALMPKPVSGSKK